MTARTYCVECKHLSHASSGRHPSQWLCAMHPNISEEGFGFVTDTTWEKAEPFLRCCKVNGGACPLFERAAKADQHET